MFLIFMCIGVACCFLLGIDDSIPYLAAVVILSRLAMTSSVVFYDSMLVDVTSEDRMDAVSQEASPTGISEAAFPLPSASAFML